LFFNQGGDRKMNLVLNTTQRLLLSQKMILSTKILQMDSQQLYEYVSSLSAENPVLEVETNEREDDKAISLRSKMEYLDSSDEQNRTYYKYEKEDADGNDDWKFKSEDNVSLSDFLKEQLLFADMPKSDIRHIKFMISCLDKNGYMPFSEKELASVLKISENDVNRLMGIIKSLEPVGVGAASVSECLLLQLKKAEKRNPTAEKIVEKYIDLLGKNQLHIISKKLHVSVLEVEKAVDVIRGLNPKPGAAFNSDGDTEYIVPDAVIEKINGKYEIRFNEQFSADVVVSSFYRNIIKAGNDEKAAAFVGKKIKQANWVIKCISKRHETILKIIRTIIDRQMDFFEHGPENIRPLLLSDVANAVNMHESTVCRAVHYKYIQCRYGVYPLSYFFHQVAAVSNGKTIIQDDIKNVIKEIIDAEDKSAPLSDRKISEELEKRGIDISRRTVAKYRSQMGILGISGRKF
jgi:RNA polymerase sigma-54 factor